MQLAILFGPFGEEKSTSFWTNLIVWFWEKLELLIKFSFWSTWVDFVQNLLDLESALDHAWCVWSWPVLEGKIDRLAGALLIAEVWTTKKNPDTFFDCMGIYNGIYTNLGPENYPLAMGAVFFLNGGWDEVILYDSIGFCNGEMVKISQHFPMFQDFSTVFLLIFSMFFSGGPWSGDLASEDLGPSGWLWGFHHPTGDSIECGIYKIYVYINICIYIYNNIYI